MRKLLHVMRNIFCRKHEPTPRESGAEMYREARAQRAEEERRRVLASERERDIRIQELLWQTELTAQHIIPERRRRDDH